MPLDLPYCYLDNKSQLNPDGAWVWAAVVTLPGSSSPDYYWVNQNLSITYQDHTYTPMGLEISETTDSGDGRLPSLTMTIANLARQLDYHLDRLDGAIGATVILQYLNTNHLAADASVLEREFTVINSVVTNEVATFSLGAHNHLRQRFPRGRYIANHCRYRFKDHHCGYTGPEPECNRTLRRCRELGNQEHYGGFTALRRGTLRFA